MPRRLLPLMLAAVAGVAHAKPPAQPRGLQVSQPAVIPLPRGASTPPAPPAARLVYIVDQLQTGPVPPYVFDKLGPLHTLQAVEDLLKDNAIPFYWARRDMPADALDPKLAPQIASLPPGEVFVIQTPAGLLMGVIVGRR